MKCFGLLIICAVLYFDQVQSEVYIPRHGLPPAGPPKARAATPVWGKSIQWVDHFDSTNKQTFYMRYLYNNQFYKPGGPIFLMLGAEWTIEGSWLQTGNMYDMAQQHNGYMFYVEHRYYGKSFPTTDLSSQNLRYLTTDQALADFHGFILEMKQIMPELAQAKVVVVGGSYGGNLALWMREKYPNVVHAAVSSSAPVLAKVDFFEYYEVIQRALGTQCSSIITRAVNTIQQYLRTAAGINKVKNDFNICNPLDTSKAHHVAYFFLTIANKFAGAIQYANSNTARDICYKLATPSTLSDYDRLANYIRGSGCMGGYDSFVAYMRQSQLGLGDSRQWTYQTCTQYAFFMTTNSAYQPFGQTITTDIYHKWCQDIFGAGFTSAVTQAGVARTNAVYGGLQPQVTRVVSVHGTIDPWHALGLSRSLHASAPVYVVNGTSHCADLSSVSSLDSVEMRNAKNGIKAYVAQWLRE